MISERSTITIGLLIVILGGASFITKTFFMAESNAQAISELKMDIKDEIRAMRLEIKELRLELKQDRVK